MTSLKALVVDDDYDFADSLADLIRMCGHDAWSVHSGGDAFDKLRNQQFDIAFIDVKMPGMSGLDVLYNLREYQLRAQIIPMTAFTLTDVLIQAVGDVRVAMMKGPIDSGDLVELVEQIAPDGVLLIADDTPNLIHWLRTSLTPLGYELRRWPETEHGVAANDQGPSHPGSGDLGETKGIVNIIDGGGTVIDEIEDWMGHRFEGLVGRSIIIARHQLPKDVSIDPFSSPDVTGCIFKPFVPEDYLDKTLAKIRSQSQ